MFQDKSGQYIQNLSKTLGSFFQIFSNTLFTGLGGKRVLWWRFQEDDISKAERMKASGLASCFSTPVSRNSGERMGSPTRNGTEHRGKSWEHVITTLWGWGKTEQRQSQEWKRILEVGSESTNQFQHHWNRPLVWSILARSTLARKAKPGLIQSF